MAKREIRTDVNTAPPDCRCVVKIALPDELEFKDVELEADVEFCDQHAYRDEHPDTLAALLTMWEYVQEREANTHLESKWNVCREAIAALGGLA